MTQRKLQNMIDTDFLRVRYVLKTTVLQHSSVTQRERKTLDSFYDTLHTLRTLEANLQRELKAVDKLRGKHQKAHALKQWNAARNVLRKELDLFHETYTNDKNLVPATVALQQRLLDFRKTLQRAKRKTIKTEALSTIRMFSKTHPLLTGGRP